MDVVSSREQLRVVASGDWDQAKGARSVLNILEITGSSDDITRPNRQNTWKRISLTALRSIFDPPESCRFSVQNGMKGHALTVAMRGLVNHKVGVEAYTEPAETDAWRLCTLHAGKWPGRCGKLLRLACPVKGAQAVCLAKHALHFKDFTSNTFGKCTKKGSRRYP